jgi:hypothetical protein
MVLLEMENELEFMDLFEEEKKPITLEMPASLFIEQILVTNLYLSASFIFASTYYQTGEKFVEFIASEVNKSLLWETIKMRACFYPTQKDQLNATFIQNLLKIQANLKNDLQGIFLKNNCTFHMDDATHQMNVWSFVMTKTLEEKLKDDMIHLKIKEFPKK